MAKDTNTSRCPGTESGCNTYFSIKTDKYFCNDGFILSFSVVMKGDNLTKDEIASIGRSCSYVIQKRVQEFCCDPEDCGQLVFGF